MRGLSGLVGRARIRFGAQLLSLDPSSIGHIPEGHRSSSRGTSSGWSRRMEYDAIQAAAELKATWADPPPIAGLRELVLNRCASSKRPEVRPDSHTVSRELTPRPRIRRARSCRDLQIRRPASPPIGPAARRRRDAAGRAHLQRHAGRVQRPGHRRGGDRASAEPRARHLTRWVERLRQWRPIDDGAAAAALMSQLVSAPVSCSSCAGTRMAGTTSAWL